MTKKGEGGGAVPGYYEAVRAYILQALTATCQKVTKSTLSEALRMEAASLDSLVAPLPPPPSLDAPLSWCSI